MEYQAKGNWKILEKWNRQNKCHHDDISNLYFAPYEQNINCKDHVIKTRRNRHQYGQKVTMTTFRTGTSWDGESWPDPAPQGDTTTWAYDAATGLVTSKLYADGYGPSYAYTADGKPATRTWARKDAQGNDLVTAYSYNLFGEMTGIDYSDSTPDIAYSYNRVGKLAQVTDAVRTRTFAYDATLDEVSETITGLYSKTLTRTYTSTGFLGKKQSLSIDNIPHYTYGFDTYGRMNRITIPSGSFSYTRLTNSDLISQMTRPNGITSTWSYETNRDLITQVQNGTISTYGYVNDAVGRRTSMSRSGSAYATPDTISYTYNDRSELTGAMSNVDTAYSYSYAYDPIGNRITASEAGVPWTYTTNNLNQYVSATENNVQLSFAYDLDGGMTYRPVDATSGWTQIWNGENRMVETTKGSDRLTLKYDYMGRRVEKCVYSGNTLASRTLFVYDGFKCVEELDGLNNNAVAMRHIWQPFDVGLDVILATADGNGTSYFLDDVNKNVKQKIDLNGIQEATYSYSPFGGVIGTDKAHIGFSSEFYDTENNMNYYNFRYISNRIARWNKRDPVGVAGGNNEYSFLNNQMNNNDFLGLDKDRNDKVRRHREISEQLLIQKLINDFEQWYLNAYNEIYDDNGNIKDDSWILKLTPCPYKIDVKHQTVKMITSAGVIYLYETYLGYDRNEWNEGVFFPFTRDTYHPGGVYELRSRNPIDGHGNQCVYDSCGNILFSKPGAGSADYSVPELPWPTKHRENDVIPYNIIIYLKKKGIKVDAMIEKYYNVRPSIYYGEDGKRRINSVIF